MDIFYTIDEFGEVEIYVEGHKFNSDLIKIEEDEVTEEHSHVGSIDAKQHLPKHIKDSFHDDEKCVVRWGWEDILCRNEDRTTPVKDVTLREAKDILSQMERSHDAEHGISWDTIDYYLDGLQLQRETND